MRHYHHHHQKQQQSQRTGLSEEAVAFVKGDDGLSTTTFNVETDYSMLGVEEVGRGLDGLYWTAVYYKCDSARRPFDEHCTL